MRLPVELSVCIYIYMRAEKLHLSRSFITDQNLVSTHEPDGHSFEIWSVCDAGPDLHGHSAGW